MAKRGFFAELQHQNQLAAKRREQADRAAAREQAAAQRKADQAMREFQRAQAAQSKAAAADQKRAEAEAKRLHIEAMQAEADSLNAQLASDFEAIDSLLAQAMEAESWVDLETLRTVAEHPPFPRADLEQPLPPPAPVQAPPEPVYVEPEAPKGLFGKKKKHEEAVAAAQAEYAASRQAWEAEAARIPALQFQQMQDYQAAEAQRQEQLAEARAAYESQCAQREADAAEANRELDELIAGLATRNDKAIGDYVGIVLANSVYPESFPVERDFEFDTEGRELTLKVSIPGPSTISDVREYKYNKAKDEIVESKQTQKAQKDRYAGAVHAVALRAIHEIFEADRDGHINTISLVVSCDDIDPATGQMTHADLVAVAADREGFTSYDLSNVVPLATLQLLNAQVSKNPWGLVSIDPTRGVRGR